MRKSRVTLNEAVVKQAKVNCGGTNAVDSLNAALPSLESKTVKKSHTDHLGPDGRALVADAVKVAMD